MPEFLLKFTEEERRLILGKQRQYIAALHFIAELHGLDVLGVNLITDLEHLGFLVPEGVQVRKLEDMMPAPPNVPPPPQTEEPVREDKQ